LEEEWGIGAHKDSSIFTILTQNDNEKGLEFMPGEEWIPILPQRGGVVVIVGDILQVLHLSPSCYEIPNWLLLEKSTNSGP
jgi:isopenicillin N synthase-like dioxygenase